MLSTRYLLPRAQRLPYTKFQRRRYTTEPKPKSSHARLYSDTFPAMIPVFLLGSAVYLGLQLVQLKLSHEKYMEEATARVLALEAEIEALQQKRANQSHSTPEIADNPPNEKPARWRWF